MIRWKNVLLLNLMMAIWSKLRVVMILFMKNKVYNPNGPNGPQYSAYITFQNDRQASIAILALDKLVYKDRTLRASYGTTKYC